MLRKFDYEKMPVVEIVNDILIDSAKRGASDIHFDPLEKHMKLRIRIDGMLVDYAEVPNEIKKNLITRIKIISGMNITESRLPQDGAIKATLKDMNLDLRVSCLPTSDGEKIVIRILDYTMSLNGLEHLGFSEGNYKKVLKMINEPNGIILVTGATGSGKSTTVYSILQRLNKEETNIITVEDPIEMDVEGVNQVQTNSEIGLTFASALRSILRQDPNVIMIGEIRDSETAKIAVRASITGHLVLSTLHTNNSLNTIERLLDMDVERYLLASSLTGIISQKLARRLCPKCRTKRSTNMYEKTLFKKVLNKDVDELFVASGCEECGNGYSGRIAIHEVLLITQEIKDALSDGLPKDKMRELVYKSDVITLLQDGLEKVINGDTSFEELLKIIELDDDENLIGQSDLKAAIENTNINHEYEDHLESMNTHTISPTSLKEEKNTISKENTITPTPLEVEKATPNETVIAPTTLKTELIAEPVQEKKDMINTPAQSKPLEKEENYINPFFKKENVNTNFQSIKEEAKQPVVENPKQDDQTYVNPFFRKESEKQEVKVEEKKTEPQKTLTSSQQAELSKLLEDL